MDSPQKPRDRFLLVVLAVGSLAFASSAQAAATRHAAQDGATTGNCTNTLGNPPCEIDYAVEMVAQTGDEVIVAPGTYSLTNPLEIGKQLDVHGVGGQPRPRLVPAPDNHVLTSAGTRVRHLEIEQSSGYVPGLLLRGAGTVGEDLLVRKISTAGPSRTGVVLTNEALLRDSVVTSAATGGAAINVAQAGDIPGVGETNLRNVTAIAPGGAGRALSCAAPTQTTTGVWPAGSRPRTSSLAAERWTW